MILAFGNKARHGKDTACEAVKAHYGSRKNQLYKHGLLPAITEVKRVNFADELRREVTAATKKVGGSTAELLVRGVEGLSIPDWVVLDPNPDMTDPLLPYGKHPKLLQWWGTELRRSQDADYWVNKWKEQVIGFKGIIVTGDLRFKNEAAAVKQLGGSTINVTRLDSKGQKFLAPDRPVNHISETDLDGHDWDFYISVKTGQVALLGELAITISEYLKGLEAK